MNDIFDELVLTTNGPKLISKLVPYIDKLIEYKSNTELNIINIKCEYVKMFKITYSDNVVQYIPSRYPIRDNKYEIKLYPTQFPLPYKKLEPNPYVVGALLTYGDFDSKLMNLPKINTTFNNYLKNKYHIVEAEKLGNDIIYYRYKDNDYYDEEITWKQFLGNLKCKLINENTKDADVFPNNYIYTDIRDRYHLISGIFDVGYDKEFFDNVNGITCKDEYRLNAVQYVLRSIGIPSQISFYNELYILTLMGNYFDYPDINYDTDDIIHHLANIDYNIPRKVEFPLEITNIEYLGDSMAYIPILENEDILYLDYLFLPVRSISL